MSGFQADGGIRDAQESGGVGDVYTSQASRFVATAKSGALKRGARGPLSLGVEVCASYQPAPKVVDTTAAGDSFNGGYLGALLSGKSQAQALKTGHDLAAQVVQYRGAIIPK